MLIYNQFHDHYNHFMEKMFQKEYTRELNESLQDGEVLHLRQVTYTAQKMKFSIEDCFSKRDQIRSFLRIWSHLLKKLLMENFFFLCSVTT